MTLVFILLIVLPLLGLVLVNFRKDGFGYPEANVAEIPYFEREKHERNSLPQSKVF